MPLSQSLEPHATIVLPIHVPADLGLTMGHEPGSSDDGWPPSNSDDTGSLSSAPDVPPLKSFDEGAMRLAATPSMQLTFFWKIENWARLLNCEMTSAEKQGLLAVDNGVPANVAVDLKRVCQHFGKRCGANAPAKRALEFFANRDKLKVGEMVSISSVEFTLCKHLLLADRVGPELMETESCFGCSCFCKTYLTPQGCTHKKLKIYKESTWLPHTICQECSSCLRCHKLLGFTLGFVVHDAFFVSVFGFWIMT